MSKKFFRPADAVAAEEPKKEETVFFGKYCDVAGFRYQVLELSPRNTNYTLPSVRLISDCCRFYATKC